MLTYQTMLDVPRELIVYLAGLLHTERRRRGTRRHARLLTPFNRAVFVLAWFRDSGDVERLGAGFGLSRATAYRYRDEGISVLTAQAPDLVEVMTAAVADGLPFLILDGKLIAIDRLTESKVSVKGNVIDAWYSGKSHDFRGGIQALIRPDGIPLWTSDVTPGSVHDITAAREYVLETVQHFLAELPILADAAKVPARASGSRCTSRKTAPSCPTTSAPIIGCCAGGDSRENVPRFGSVAMQPVLTFEMDTATEMIDAMAPWINDMVEHNPHVQSIQDRGIETPGWLSFLRLTTDLGP